MLKMTEDEMYVLGEQVLECYPVNMLQDIQQWMKETDNEVVYATLETVMDIIIDNTVFDGI